VTARRQDLLALAPEERARAGLFLAFQYPVEIPGVSNAYFLRRRSTPAQGARRARRSTPLDFLALREGEDEARAWTRRC
jgi:Fe-S cluster assembly ATP-binding protein